MADDNNLKKKEMEIFNKYKRTGDKRYFQELYGSMKGLVYGAAKKAAYGSNLPESAHKVYAAQAFMEALKTFNPSKGTALNTHVYNSVQQKAKRLNYMYQNLGSMPEPRAQKVGLFQTEVENLRSELGRDPTNEEISRRLGLSMTEIRHLSSEISKDLSMGEGTEEVAFAETSKEQEAVKYLWWDLNPQEKVVYEFVMGKNGKSRMVKANNKIDFEGIGRSMGCSASKVRVIWTGIKKKFEKAVK